MKTSDVSKEYSIHLEFHITIIIHKVKGYPGISQAYNNALKIRIKLIYCHYIS
jgi:hypothetical protein